MIVLRDKNFTIDYIAKHLKPGSGSRLISEGQQKIGNPLSKKLKEAHVFIRRVAPKRYDVRTPEGAGNIVEDAIGNVGKVVGFAAPLPGLSIAGAVVDKKYLHPFGRFVGGWVTKAGKAIGRAADDAQPYYKYNLRPT